jgi:hypothetical protein
MKETNPSYMPNKYFLHLLIVAVIPVLLIWMWEVRRPDRKDMGKNNSGISNSSSSKSLDTSAKAYRQGYSDGRTGYGQPASSTVSAADYYMSRGYNFSSADQLVYKMGYEDGLYGRTKRY